MASRKGAHWYDDDDLDDGYDDEDWDEEYDEEYNEDYDDGELNVPPKSSSTGPGRSTTVGFRPFLPAVYSSM